MNHNYLGKAKIVEYTTNKSKLSLFTLYFKELIFLSIISLIYLTVYWSLSITYLENHLGAWFILQVEKYIVFFISIKGYFLC